MQGFGRRVCVDMLKYISPAETPAAEPASIFAGFSTATINADASGYAEPTIGTGGYARSAVTFGAVATPTSGSPAVLQNSSTVTWGPSSAAWSTGATPLTAIGYWTASTGVTEATFVAAGNLSSPPQVNGANVTITASAGALQLTLAQT